MDVVDENETINHLVDAMETLNLEEDDDAETVIQAPNVAYRCIGEQKWAYGINILRSAGRNRMQDIIVSIKYEYDYELTLNSKCIRTPGFMQY